MTRNLPSNEARGTQWQDTQSQVRVVRPSAASGLAQDSPGASPTVRMTRLTGAYPVSSGLSTSVKDMSPQMIRPHATHIAISWLGSFLTTVVRGGGQHIVTQVRSFRGGGGRGVAHSTRAQARCRARTGCAGTCGRTTGFRLPPSPAGSAPSSTCSTERHPACRGSCGSGACAQASSLCSVSQEQTRWRQPCTAADATAWCRYRLPRARARPSRSRHYHRCLRRHCRSLCFPLTWQQASN